MLTHLQIGFECVALSVRENRTTEQTAAAAQQSGVGDHGGRHVEVMVTEIPGHTLWITSHLLQCNSYEVQYSMWRTVV